MIDYDYEEEMDWKISVRTMVGRVIAVHVDTFCECIYEERLRPDLVKSFPDCAHVKRARAYKAAEEERLNAEYNT